MVDCIWKLEYAVERGLHLHCILLFNGANCREDISFGNLIGDYWKNKITKGYGVYHNCNRYAYNYKRLGIGMIDHSDLKKRSHLLYAAMYLVKKDLYFNIVRDEEGVNRPIRTFGKGVVKLSKKGKGGRPRKKQQVPASPCLGNTNNR